MTPILFLMGLDDPPPGLPRQVPYPPAPGPTGRIPAPTASFPAPGVAAGFQQDAFGALLRCARVIGSNPGVRSAISQLMHAPIRERYEVIDLVLSAYRPGALGRIRALVTQDQHCTGILEEDALRVAVGRELAATVFTVITTMAQRGDFSPTRVPIAGDLPGAGLAWSGPMSPLPKPFGPEGRAVAVSAGLAFAGAVEAVACSIAPAALIGVGQLVRTNLRSETVCAALRTSASTAKERLLKYAGQDADKPLAGLGAEAVSNETSPYRKGSATVITAWVAAGLGLVGLSVYLKRKTPRPVQRRGSRRGRK